MREVMTRPGDGVSLAFVVVEPGMAKVLTVEPKSLGSPLEGLT
jgi:hypothetical protein